MTKRLLDRSQTVSRSIERQLSDVSAAERHFVSGFRRMLDGSEGRARMQASLTPKLGRIGTKRLLRAFELFLDALTEGQRRDLTRQETDCLSIGADELLLAGIVRSAASGDAESAASQASDVVRQNALALLLERAALLGSLLDYKDKGSISPPGRRARLH
ncbi:MAG: hypothetical protein AAGF44_01025 [Pseudomonadota bacterium]